MRRNSDPKSPHKDVPLSSGKDLDFSHLRPRGLSAKYRNIKICFWFEFLSKVSSLTLCSEATSTYGVTGKRIKPKMENKSRVLTGTLVTMPIFTDKQCVVRLTPGGCPSEWWVGGQVSLAWQDAPELCAPSWKPLLHQIRQLFPLVPAVFWATLDAVIHDIVL